MDNLSRHIESLIFVSEDPITLKEVMSCLKMTYEHQFTKQEILQAIENLIKEYRESDRAFEIVEINQGYQFLTKGAYFQTVSSYLKLNNRSKLSKAALETLAIVAYKQPVPKTEVEKIRGVNCDYTIQKLLEKELVEILGRGDGPGRPLIYATSSKFMKYFGLNSIKDLPQPKDFKVPESEIGEVAPIEENIENESQNN